MNSLNKEQKSGILFLLTSKTFERMAFFFVIPILIHFLNELLEFEFSKATIYYSLCYGAIGITSLFAGFLGDKLNRIRIVKIGFLILTIFYLVIVFLPNIPLLIATALVLLGVGIGLISPNIVVLLGNTYNEKGNEIKGLSGFILYEITFFVGALIVFPLSTLVKSEWGFYPLFIFAFIFGLLALILFLKFDNCYQKMDLIAKQKEYSETTNTKKLHRLIFFSVLAIGILIQFALYQKGKTFYLVVHDLLDNKFLLNEGWSNIEKIISLILSLLLVFLVLRVKRWNWDKLFNLILIGIVFGVIAFILMGSFVSPSKINGNSLIVNAYICIVIAETLIAPVLRYIVYRSAPLQYKGLYQGICYLFIGITNLLLFLGILMYQKSAVMAFVVFGIILIIAAVLILLLKKRVNDTVAEIEKDGEEVLVEGEV